MEIIYLTQITEILKINFHSNWWKQYEFDRPDINSDDDKITSFADFTSQVIDKVFDEFNISLLVGEYVLNGFIDKLDEMIQHKR